MGNGSDRMEEVSAKIAGQEFSAKGMQLNTLLTLIVLLICAAIAALLWNHSRSTEQRDESFVGALKEQTIAQKESTQALRERNCLEKFEIKDRPANADWCKQLSK